MNRNMFTLAAGCCLTLAAISCTQDDPDTGEIRGDSLTVSAVCPQTVETDHRLRCILELRTAGDASRTVYRGEALAESGSGRIDFDLDIPEGTYTCLMWADYIDSGNPEPSGAGAYPDKYYTTSDLNSVEIKSFDALEGNSAGQCFYWSGEIRKGAEILQEEFEMKPAFTRISIRENNLDEFSYLKSVSLTCNVYSKFDVETGTIIGDAESWKFENPAFDPAPVADGTLFSTYMFADSNGRKVGGVSIELTKSVGDDIKSQEITVPEDIISLLPGQHVIVRASMMDVDERDNEFMIDFDVDVDDWTSSEVEIPSSSK